MQKLQNLALALGCMALLGFSGAEAGYHHYEKGDAGCETLSQRVCEPRQDCNQRGVMHRVNCRPNRGSWEAFEIDWSLRSLCIRILHFFQRLIDFILYIGEISRHQTHCFRIKRNNFPLAAGFDQWISDICFSKFICNSSGFFFKKRGKLLLSLLFCKLLTGEGRRNNLLQKLCNGFLDRKSVV